MVKIHSQVGLITNSSTVIYTCATVHTIETAKALINGILALSGSDKTADDLYDFEIIKDEEESWHDYNEDGLKITDKQGNEVKDFNSFFNSFNQDAEYDG